MISIRCLLLIYSLGIMTFSKTYTRQLIKKSLVLHGLTSELSQAKVNKQNKGASHAIVSQGIRRFSISKTKSENYMFFANMTDKQESALWNSGYYILDFNSEASNMLSVSGCNLTYNFALYTLQTPGVYSFSFEATISHGKDDGPPTLFSNNSTFLNCTNSNINLILNCKFESNTSTELSTARPINSRYIKISNRPPPDYNYAPCLNISIEANDFYNFKTRLEQQIQVDPAKLLRSVCLVPEKPWPDRAFIIRGPSEGTILSRHCVTYLYNDSDIDWANKELMIYDHKKTLKFIRISFVILIVLLGIAIVFCRYIVCKMESHIPYLDASRAEESRPKKGKVLTNGFISAQNSPPTKRAGTSMIDIANAPFHSGPTRVGSKTGPDWERKDSFELICNIDFNKRKSFPIIKINELFFTVPIRTPPAALGKRINHKPRRGSAMILNLVPDSIVSQAQTAYLNTRHSIPHPRDAKELRRLTRTEVELGKVMETQRGGEKKSKYVLTKIISNDASDSEFGPQLTIESLYGLGLNGSSPDMIVSIKEMKKHIDYFNNNTRRISRSLPFLPNM